MLKTITFSQRLCGINILFRGSFNEAIKISLQS